MDIFRPDPELSEADRTRLGHWLANYNLLNEGLVLDEFPLEDLKRLVLLERDGQRRKPFLRRLVGRVVASERRRVWSAVIGEEAP